MPLVSEIKPPDKQCQTFTDLVTMMFGISEEFPPEAKAKRCKEPTEYQVIAGCIHEHMAQPSLCGNHYATYSCNLALGNIFCGYCWNNDTLPHRNCIVKEWKATNVNNSDNSMQQLRKET